MSHYHIKIYCNKQHCGNQAIKTSHQCTQFGLKTWSKPELQLTKKFMCMCALLQAFCLMKTKYLIEQMNATLNSKWSFIIIWSFLKKVLFESMMGSWLSLQYYIDPGYLCNEIPNSIRPILSCCCTVIVLGTVWCRLMCTHEWLKRAEDAVEMVRYMADYTVNYIQL